MIKTGIKRNNKGGGDNGGNTSGSTSKDTVNTTMVTIDLKLYSLTINFSAEAWICLNILEILYHDHDLQLDIAWSLVSIPIVFETFFLQKKILVVKGDFGKILYYEVFFFGKVGENFKVIILIVWRIRQMGPTENLFCVFIQLT